MTEPAHLRMVSINLPSDVADRLEREPDAGAYVTDVIRARVRAEQFEAILAERGMLPTTEGIARAAARRAAVEAEWPAARYQQARDRMRREIEAQRQADQRARQAPAA